MTRRCFKSAVESRGTAAARYLHERARECETAGLIDIKPVVQHPADDACRLADAEDQHPARCGSASERVLAKPREQVANAGKTCAGDIGIVRAVVKFIDCTWLESAIQLHSPWPASALRCQEAPVFTRDWATRIIGPRPFGQHRRRVIRCRRLVRQPAHYSIGCHLS